MKKFALLITSTALIAAGCADQADIDSSLGASSSNQEVQSFDFAAGALIAGSKVEGKRKSPFSFEYKTTATPNDTYTVWICGWDDPGECIGSGSAGEGNNLCSAVDLGAPSFFCEFGGGDVADGNGRVVIEGDQAPDAEVPFGDGFDNLFGAEVHLILRSHGPEIPGRLEEQISTFEGGCDVNVCEDQQFAILPPL